MADEVATPDDVENNVVKIGTGGKLYKDAREKEVRRQKQRSVLVDKLGANENLEDEHKKLPPYADRPEPVKRPAPQQPAWGTASTANVPEEPEIPRDWRGIISTTLELWGIAAITTGFWELADWLGPIALGVCLILMGVALGIPPGASIRKPANAKKHTSP